MSDLKAVNLGKITKGIRNATRPVKILWQADDTLAFVARGREHRSEFHSDPADEVMYMINVTDYNADPVSRAYEEFYGSEKGRSCAGCLRERRGRCLIGEASGGRVGRGDDLHGH